MHSPKAVIIVAGGSGLRMNSDIPKQFLELHGKPILMHTIEKFFIFDSNITIVVVLPSAHVSYWQKCCVQHQFVIKHQLAIGGKTRFDSVLSGLKLVSNAKFIAVHDAVRPLVSVAIIERCFVAATDFGAAIPVTDCVESVRVVQGSRSAAVDRNDYKLVQTPQVFQADLLQNAYKQNYNPSFTDDASVVEAFMHSNNSEPFGIHLVVGSRENIKITSPEDLIIAHAFLKK